MIEINIKTYPVERVVIREGGTAQVLVKPAANSVRIVQSNALAPSTASPLWAQSDW